MEDGMKPSLFMLVVMTLLCFSACGGGNRGTTITPPPATYNIGGTVSGLSGTGLVLQDDGGNNLPISGNGPFTFTTPVPSGNPYSVAVLTQPSSPAQTCIVTNGGGTANTSISNVQVICSTFTIGGTVSGLSGTGLVLQNNGGDNLQINANGNFTFITPIAVGGTYTVTVATQPLNQTCVVANGAGTANANVTNVQVSCTSNGQVLYSFGSAPDGNYPAANLVFDDSGNLYGTTVQGGAFGYGTVFRLAPSNGQWAETVLYSFCPQYQHCVDGANPYSGLVLDAAGNLYGTTFQGGAYGENGGTAIGDGVAFELSPHPDGTWTETVLHSFGNGTDGTGPLAGLVFDNAGNLYGATDGGGMTDLGVCPGGCGTVFELSPGSNGQWTEKVLYEFCSQANCGDGAGPLGGVTLDSSGNLYGTTNLGGTPAIHLYGTVFELTPSEGGQWVETVLYMFQGGSMDGSNPDGGVILDKSGNLYGTTQFGYEAKGINNGIVFELARESGGQWKEIVLYGFCGSTYCADGSAPLAGLVFDKAGNLYGTTFSGGPFDWGVVFELIPSKTGGWIYAVPYAFPGGADGFNPHAGVITDSAGNLYGVTYDGGTYGYGVVFEVAP
jgi:uncharacterized repeat protein (TIGR03803 family)